MHRQFAVDRRQYQIHYDENLANYPVYRGYVISSWPEL